jgi:hypothetical protein
MNISNTTGRTIPAPVPRDRLCAQTEAVLRHFGASGITMAEIAGGMYCNPEIPGRNRKTGKTGWYL